MSWIIVWLNSKFYLALTIGKTFLPLGNEVHPPKPPPPSPKYLSLTLYLYFLPFPSLPYFTLSILLYQGYCGELNLSFDQLRVIRSIKGNFVWPQAVFDAFHPELVVDVLHGVYSLQAPKSFNSLSVDVLYWWQTLHFSDFLTSDWPAWFCWCSRVNISHFTGGYFAPLSFSHCPCSTLVYQCHVCVSVCQ